MRLWHKDLIPVLPKQQLIAQWRECCAIASNIAKKGTPNHILVNKVLDYPVEHFKYYTYLILSEIRKRGYKTSLKSMKNFEYNLYLSNKNKSFATKPLFLPMAGAGCFEGWHNDRYLLQCIMNLQEKYDCGMWKDNPDEVQPLLDYISKKKIVY